VSVLSLFKHLNYKPWYALAEFVDNALQSYLSNKKRLQVLHGKKFHLKVEIETDTAGEGRIVVRDNAAGIATKDYPRAFKPAQPPPDRTGLAEFGVGMKSAACWWAHSWSVRTSALGEPIEREISFDVLDIVKNSTEVLSPREKPASANDHYTEITLKGLHHKLHGRTIGKVKEHLASMYRVFLRAEDMEIRFDGEVLSYETPEILSAPLYRNEKGKPRTWKQEVDLKIGKHLRVVGFAAIRAKASTTHAGFALFRRGRVIQGSADDTYRPERIFGKSNSFVYQRVFGELHIEGVEVSHTKDGFQWEGEEEPLLEALRKLLDEEPNPLLEQAESHRVRPKKAEVGPAAQSALDSTAQSLQEFAGPVMESHMRKASDQALPPTLPVASLVGKTQFQLHFRGLQWIANIDATLDAGVGPWLEIAGKPTTKKDTKSGETIREVSIRVSLAHPFMVHYGGTTRAEMEPLLRLAAALALAEVVAREAGVQMAGSVRATVNDLLRDALWRRP
jgi:hypothetical protein